MKWTAIQLTAVICAAFAALVSYNLYHEHLTGKASLSFLSLGCSDQAGPSALDCRKVTQSRWGVLPFVRDSDPPGKKRMPVSYLGWVYYSMLTVWLIGIGRPSPSRFWLHLLPLALNGVGVLTSLFFIFIMATQLGAWCTQCLVTHVLNFAIFGLLTWMWPRREALAAAPPAAAAQPQALRAAAPHPSLRVMILTAAAILMTFVFQTGRLVHPAAAVQMKRMVMERDEYKKQMDAYLADGKAAFDSWFRREGVTISLREDDPTKVKEGLKPLRLVVFSDFECPQCARAASSLSRVAEPLFDGHLQITFKHYPLCKDCNEVNTNAHPNACYAAYAAEAARLQDGEAFWKAHDWMFTHQGRLSMLGQEKGMREFARQFKLDEDLFVGEMNSEAVISRVMEDAREGKRLGIGRTPAVYMEGGTTGKYKLLNNLFDTNNPRFWQAAAQTYWYEVIRKPPPDAVKKLLEQEAPSVAATPDTPGPPDES